METSTVPGPAPLPLPGPGPVLQRARMEQALQLVSLVEQGLELVSRRRSQLTEQGHSLAA